ncbi:tetratricopeptide repeat protein [Desulfobacterales bacterium HSG2]|nr:tetratricopeptide repeat protein [Desulfobacterales bacterium HSG2]
MAKKKKITRKQLLKEPDEFLTFSRKLFRFVMEHKDQIAIGFGVFLTIIIIISGIRYLSDRSENKASALVREAMVKYEAAVKDNGPEKAYADVEENFQKILEEYSGKDAGKIAKVEYAGICYDAGNTDKAIELYKEALQDFNVHPSFGNLILSGLGYAYEKKKDYKTAVTYFEKITRGPNPLMKDEAFFNLGRLYAEMGEADKSTEAFKTLLSDYTDSMYIELVKEKVN